MVIMYLLLLQFEWLRNKCSMNNITKRKNNTQINEWQFFLGGVKKSRFVALKTYSFDHWQLICGPYVPRNPCRKKIHVFHIAYKKEWFSMCLFSFIIQGKTIKHNKSLNNFPKSVNGVL